MKMMKKLATLLLAVCLVLPGFSMVAQAAEGDIMFTDPTTKVGETLELRGVLKADSNIEDRTISMTYDTTMLKFIEGENVTETSEGNLTYEVLGQKDTDRVEFIMKFDVLKEGTTEVKVTDYKAWNTNNDEINCAKGSSTIVIEAGEGTATDPETPAETTGVTVDVNGVSYTLTSTFADTDIPKGFSKTTFDYQGTECQAVANEAASVFLGYLVDANGAGSFYLYLMDSASFVPYEPIEISDTVVIALLSNTSEVSLPTTYAPTEVIVNGNAYPAWQSMEDTTRCILYALNSNGEKALYQFDTTEGTYQRFEAPTDVEEEKDEESMLGELADILKNNLDVVVLGAGLGIIVLLILVIILSVKLYNRNAELDELYDEYGIDLDEEEPEEKPAKREKRKAAYEEDLEELEEDELEEDEIMPVFVDIDGETEDDVVMEADEANFEEDDSEIEVEFFEEVSQADAKEIFVEKAQADAEEIFVEEEQAKAEVEEDIQIMDAEDVIRIVDEEDDEEAEEDDEYFDDDDDMDFEMDFIDLDD